MRLWQQYSRIYGYHVDNLFKNKTEQVNIASMWNAIETVAKTRASSETVGDEARLAIDYFNWV